MNSTSSPGSERRTGKAATVYLDLTHLGRHVTGIERIAIELFETQAFEGAKLVPVRSRGLISMIFKQQVWLPLQMLFKPSAKFVFPGFPPSPLFAFAPERAVLYVHDLFLLQRRADLSSKAKLYMAKPFGIAVRRLRHFLVNSEKTAAELKAVTRADAEISLYRPSARNVFGLSAEGRGSRAHAPRPLRLVSVGTVEPRKNYPAAAAITARLAAILPGGAELHIIGRPGWGADTETLRTSPHVVLHGFLSSADARRVIEAADVYLCTSHDEGLGLPLLEVQYAGLPVVAPDQAVFREVLGTSAVFIDPADVAGAAKRIAELVSAETWRLDGELGANANITRWNQNVEADGARVRRMFYAPGFPGLNGDGISPSPNLS